MQGLSPVAASGGHSSSRCAGLPPSRPLPLRSTGSRRAGSVSVAHGPSRSAACGIFPDQGWNPCPLHWQADSQPLRHQGSPEITHLDKDMDVGLQAYVDIRTRVHNPFSLGYACSGQDCEGLVTIYRRGNSGEGKRSGSPRRKQ